jgi:N-acetylneuraminic acid mutarotase
MRAYAIVTLLVLMMVPLARAESTNMEVRVYFTDADQLTRQMGDLLGDLDIATVGEMPDGTSYLVVITTREELKQIQDKGFTTQITYADIRDKFLKMTGIDLRKPHDAINFGYFLTYQEMRDTIGKLAANYPQIVTIDSTMHSYQGNKHLYCLKISDNPGTTENEPQVFINGATHAREPMGTHACIAFATLLCTKYGVDSTWTWTVNNREIYIVPVMNPDGYVYNSDSAGDGYWRKNRNNTSPRTGPGVDLNRNYGYKWGYDGSGSSGTPSSETYRGPSRFSEPETQACSLFQHTHKFRTEMDFHTYGRYNLYSYGYRNRMPIDSLPIKEAGETLRTNNGYTATGTIYRTLYAVNGGSTDWESADTLQGIKFYTYSFSTEMGTTDFYYGSSDPTYVAAEVALNIPNCYYLTRIAGAYLKPVSMVVNDTPVGNRTAQLDPGETANLWFTVRNWAIHPLDTAKSVTAVLRSSNPLVTVITPSANFPVINPRRGSSNNGAAQIQVQCDPSVPPGTVDTLRLEVTFTDDGVTMMQPVNYTITIGNNPINIHDVGCTRIMAPVGALDSGTVVTPACSVYNFGAYTETYTARMKIGSSYNSTVTISSHAASARLYVTFPTWTASPVGGPYAVSCSTELTTDAVRTNDKQTGNVTVLALPNHDVGCTRILAPFGVLDSGTAVTPACSVYNYGNRTETYTARMKIGAAYNTTVSVTGHSPLATIYVTFPTWTALPVGTLPVSCSTELAVDANRANDKQTGSVIVRSPPTHDVGCTRLMAPIGTLDSGVNVSPACSVFNFGSSSESYTVRCKIGSAYNFTALVTGHSPLVTAYVTFPSWTALPVGTLPVSCSTDLAVDALRANDKQTGSVIVRRPPAHDVGCTRITAPSGITDSGQTIAPACSVANYGTASETYTVRMSIGTAYNSAVIVSSHSPGARLAVVFPGWMALQRGSYAVKCSTELAGDGAQANDAQTGSVDVRVTDLGATAILAPAETLDSSVAIVPSASISNFSSVSISGTAYFVITNGPTIAYSDNQAASLTPGQALTVTFTTWAKPHLPGTYSTRCSTYVAGDQNHANDALTGSVTITGAVSVTPGWTRKADMPAGPKTKNVKDGCCLAYYFDGELSYVYAPKGNNRCEFYQYDMRNNTWAAKESVPAIGRAGKKKAVKKGASITELGGTLYLAKGNNSVEFWAYRPGAPGVWTQVSDVPPGAKTVREGSGAVGVARGDTAFVYFLKGSGTQEFYRYNTTNNAWEALTPAPLGTSNKTFKNGSCIAYDGDNTIYALKGSYNELFAYDVDSNAWAARTALPLIGREGKKRKVKDGAGLAWYDGAVYALKGGNTYEFWTYNPVADHWTQSDDILTGAGKRVKGGGALVCASASATLFATKGNNTLEFYSYGPLAAYESRLTAGGPNEMSDSQLSTFNLKLSAVPNPFSGTTTINYSLPKAGNISLTLYDITGALVTTLVKGYHGTGATSFILQPSALPSGIYVLRLDTDDAAVSRKLIVR